MSKTRLRTIFQEELNVEVPDDDTLLLETGLLDSLLFVELLVHLESEFGISVSLEELEFDDFRSLSTIATYVSKAQRPLESGQRG